MGYKLHLQMYESPSPRIIPAFSSDVMTDIPGDDNRW